MQVRTYVLRYSCTSLIKVLKTTGDTYIQTKNIDLKNSTVGLINFEDSTMVAMRLNTSVLNFVTT